MYSEIVSTDTSIEQIAAMNPYGIVLSGGPESVFEPGAPDVDQSIYELGIPVLGICYGHQLIAKHFGGKIEHIQGEYGKADLQVVEGVLMAGVADTSTIWMNHGDSVTQMPKGFVVTAKTPVCPIAAYENIEQKIYSVQFHPEVHHSEYGMQILENFVEACGAQGTWQVSAVVEQIVSEIQAQVGDKNVFLMVSGGVDSSVAFALLTKALGADRVVGLFVDHGLLRQDEAGQVKQMLATAGFTNLHVAHESDAFLSELAGVYAPEEKRKIIGRVFLEVQQKWVKKLGLNAEDWLLGQGTIYPDHIETGGSKHASKIKTHHNRVPEIEALMAAGKVVEPLKNFYKDEVRELGSKLGLPAAMIARHPFPGPGLGVRILCQAAAKTLENATELQNIVEEKYNIQSMVLPVQSVGVQGDARSYKHPLALFTDQDIDSVHALATDLPNRISEVNRVIVSLTHDTIPETWFVQERADISRDRIAILQEADARIQEILQANSLHRAVWQFPVVLLSQGSEENTFSIILRPIQSEEAMTATAVVFEQNILHKMNTTLLDIPQVSSVFLDLTHKPPGTIEWE